MKHRGMRHLDHEARLAAVASSATELKSDLAAFFEDDLGPLCDQLALVSAQLAALCADRSECPSSRVLFIASAGGEDYSRHARWRRSG